jgi:outer membrane protein TolC
LLIQIEQHNSQYNQAKLAELIAETDLRIAQAERHPKVDLFAGYQFSNSFSEVGFISLNRNFGPTVGATVSFNLFNGGKTNLLIKNSEVYRKNAALTKEQTHHNLDADVLKMYHQYQSLKDRVVLAESNVSTIQQVYDVASEQFKRGAINGYDFRLTQQTLLNAQLTLMELQFSLKSIEINLNRLSGNVLEAYL